MKFQETALPGVFVLEPEPHGDDRGFFSRLYCPEEFAAVGISFKPVQTSLSRNVSRHTLRGLHYRSEPYDEAKLVHVTCGSIYEVVIDARPESAAFGRWAAFYLDMHSLRAVYVPEGCAHGFLTLEPHTDVLYQIGRMYAPGFDRGYRWNDPILNIHWPAEPAVISDPDKRWPDFIRRN